jgi:HlyD family secretion protein
MEHAQANAQAMTVRAPIPGLVVPKITWRGNGPTDIQEGDEMYPGAPVLQVVNQASMLVRVRVNQADLPFVRVGQPAVVHLDAYPDLAMPGRVEEIAPIGVKGSFSNRLREFTAIVSVAGSNARLLPDLTAAIDVEVERVKDALVVPRAAVDHDGRAARVHVRDASGVAARQVTLGPAPRSARSSRARAGSDAARPPTCQPPPWSAGRSSTPCRFAARSRPAAR